MSGLVLLATGLALLTYSSQSLASYRDALLDLPSLGSDAAAINDLDSVCALRSLAAALAVCAQCIRCLGDPHHSRRPRSPAHRVERFRCEERQAAGNSTPLQDLTAGRMAGGQ